MRGWVWVTSGRAMPCLAILSPPVIACPRSEERRLEMNTTMDYTSTLRAVRGLKVQTGSLACLGCGYEHGCSVHGCAILRNVVEHMEAALANYDHLSALVEEQAKTIRAYERQRE